MQIVPQNSVYTSLLTPLKQESSTQSNPILLKQQAIKKTENNSPCYKKISIKIGEFLKDNWKKILLYLVAWILIIACYGAVCGFSEVAFPFTIWMSIGVGLGFVFGIITAMLVDPKNKWRGKNSLWDLMNLGLLQLDENGTRQVLLASVITVISTALTAFPRSLGGFIGFCAGNQLAVKMCYGLKLGSSEAKVLSEKKIKKVRDLEDALTTASLIKDNLLIKIQNLELKKRMEQIENFHSKVIKKTENIETENDESATNITCETHAIESQSIYKEHLQELNNKMRKCNTTIDGINACLRDLKNR